MDVNNEFEINLNKIFVAKAFKFCMKNINMNKKSRSDEINLCVKNVIQCKKTISFADYEKIN